MKHTQAFLDYRSTLPKRKGGTGWTIESFSKAVELLAYGFIVEDGQEWDGVGQPLWLVCPTHGRYKVTPNDFLKHYKGTGCAKCNAQKNSDSAGKRRSPRASVTEKDKAKTLYAELCNYAEVGRILGRGARTIQIWCDPDAAEKQRLLVAKNHMMNIERDKASCKRYRTECSHGKANAAANSARRRKLKRGEMEWLDEVNGLVTLLSPPTTGEDLTKEQAYYIECERLTKETGIQHHVDHIWPLSKGGEHIFYNLQVITADENLSKGGKYRPEDQALYAMRIAMLFSDSI